MQWWCSARATAWSWEWSPYPGVWLMLGVLVAGWVWVHRRAGAEASAGRTAAFGLGALALWLALDWPVGALAAGYLASVHMVQFLLVGLVAPPLLLLGVPGAAWERLDEAAGHRRSLRFATHPLVAFVVFNVVVGVTHWPTVVDGLMASQLGSFAIDMAWLAGGTALWWPVIAPVPEREGFSYPVKMGYLVAVTVTSTAPFLYLTFSELPVYATYELAPPIEGISTREDQQAAGILMKLGGAVVLWTALTVLFWRWYREEQGAAG
ncbi:MAG: cytochrome c oxidase assembly protein [Gemmatimonadota bacterium]|nr:cytochrome c oxidase assembly protein [Gemmatimonadota bacterium]